ncbi:OmpA family protein [Qipengyuania sp. JC766]|uniref:OmpA family protein n=1 Tax=Qipengyuania sp. JC766 TaxID=3232139 RepID=UPI00345AFF2A
MAVRPPLVVAAGAALSVACGLIASAHTSRPFAERLASEAQAALGDSGVTANFALGDGQWPTRHPQLTAPADMNEAQRARFARAVHAIAGVGGIDWSDGTARAVVGETPITPLHCQEDVEALLDARTIRFEESSVEISSASDQLIEEVASALRPCLGAEIAIEGHTDNSGPAEENTALSYQRAAAVREALVAKGIPRDALRARGLGSSEPVEGLAPTDPANRRIEFSVIAVQPLIPTPVDTPGPR